MQLQRQGRRVEGRSRQLATRIGAVSEENDRRSGEARSIIAEKNASTLEEGRRRPWCAVNVMCLWLQVVAAAFVVVRGSSSFISCCELFVNCFQFHSSAETWRRRHTNDAE